MPLCLVQVKEYRQHCFEQLQFFQSELALKSIPEQEEALKRNEKYYLSEIARLDVKIANWVA